MPKIEPGMQMYDICVAKRSLMFLPEWLFEIVKSYEIALQKEMHWKEEK